MLRKIAAESPLPQGSRVGVSHDGTSLTEVDKLLIHLVLSNIEGHARAS